MITIGGVQCIEMEKAVTEIGFGQWRAPVNTTMNL
jgi:hypothetical protein